MGGATTYIPMMTVDQFLSHLESLVLSQDANGLVQAEDYIAELLQSSSDDRSDAAQALGEVQAQLLRRTPTSRLRTDIADMLSAKILGLLEPE